MTTASRPGAALAQLRARTGTGAAYVVTAVIVFLILQNAVFFVWNQRALPAFDRLRISSRDIEHNAMSHPRGSVYAHFAPYYFLQQRIGGAHIVLPRWAFRKKWWFEHLGHLHTELARGTLRLRMKHARLLRKRSEWNPRYIRLRKDPRERRGAVSLFLIRDPKATRYVLVGTTGSTEIFVLPEADYAAMRASDRASP